MSLHQSAFVSLLYITGHLQKSFSGSMRYETIQLYGGDFIIMTDPCVVLSSYTDFKWLTHLYFQLIFFFIPKRTELSTISLIVDIPFVHILKKAVFVPAFSV